MILDSSAIVALLLNEPGRDELREKIEAAEPVGVGAPTLVETGIVLQRRARHSGLLDGFLARSAVVVVPFGLPHWHVAVEAWERFGKGRHPAQLNLGDCLAYATAKVAGQPLLCTGDDFSKTDLQLA